MEPLNVFVVNSQQFEWTSFLWGGAAGSFIGAFIILGIEKILSSLLEERRNKKEENKISLAFNIEIDQNIVLCDNIIKTMGADKTSYSWSFARFKILWTEKYSEKYIDYTNSDSLRLCSFLYCVKALNDQITDIQNNHKLLSDNKEKLLNLVKELKVILLSLKIRKNNKIFAEDLKNNAKKLS